jgi:multidrug efflux pump
VVVDRDKIATLGMTQQDVGNAMGAALGGGYVNYFSISGRSYKVIPQVQQVDRLNPSDVLDFYIKTPNGVMPASTVASMKYTCSRRSVNRFQQLNSVTIQGVPGGRRARRWSTCAAWCSSGAVSGYTVDYSGQSRQFVQESGNFAVTLLFAVIIVFLALAAQFESFRDPVVILLSVPLALFGAMIFIFWGFASMNIYTQVGLVTLMGLISKHGILIVEVANRLQRQGLSKLRRHRGGGRHPAAAHPDDHRGDGVRRAAAGDRLGRGCGGPQAMGLVIFTGLSIGTLFTLFVVPAMYLAIAARHRKEENEDAPDTHGTHETHATREPPSLPGKVAPEA